MRRATPWWCMVVGLGMMASGCRGTGGQAWPPNLSERAGKPVRVACVGDSLTSGFKMAHPEAQAYPAQLGKLLGSGWEVRGFAVPGRTALKDANLSLWKEEVFRQAQAWEPEVVILCLGTNDSFPPIWDKGRGQFAADYRAMVQLFATLPSKPRLWLCLPPPMFLKPDNIQLRTMATEINPVIREVAKAEGCGLIDWYTRLTGKSGLFMADTVHPLPTGAAVMAEGAWQALTQP